MCNTTNLLSSGLVPLYYPIRSVGGTVIGNCTVQGVCEIVGLLKQMADLTDVVTADSNRRAFCRRVRIYWVRLDPQARMELRSYRLGIIHGETWPL